MKPLINKYNVVESINGRCNNEILNRFLWYKINLFFINNVVITGDKKNNIVYFGRGYNN